MLFRAQQTRQPSPSTPAKPERSLTKLLSEPLILEEMGPPRIMTQFVGVASVLLAGLLLWSALTEIRETALAQGQVIPAGSVHSVQHLEGGIIAEIPIEEGDIVEAGQVLVSLESAGAEAELEQLRARSASLALLAERLRAFVLERTPDFSVADQFPGLIADQHAILEMQNEARDNQRAVLLSRVDQRRAQAEALADQRASLEKQLVLLEEEAQLQRDLLDKGLVSRVAYLETERTVTRTRGEFAAVISEMASAGAAEREAHGNLAELDSSLRNEALKEMGKVTAELAQVREAMAKLEDRVNRLQITAPARGIVKGLAATTIGGVLASGETVMEIIPFDDSLVAEARISPRDVGHLRVGQDAQIKVSTFDVARFGSVDGQLKQVSASTFEDEQGDPYYKGIVELGQNHVGRNPALNVITPGMVVDVAINTGSKSLLAYLLRPVYRGLDGAFHER
jgi:HlyD family secretion protein/adhesin transport system membrane fusion protein